MDGGVHTVCACVVCACVQQVYGVGSKKISVAAVTTSSDYNIWNNGGKIIDGNKKSMWHSKCRGQTEWVKLDLGTVQAISQVVVHNRPDSNAIRINHAELIVDGKVENTFMNAQATYKFNFANYQQSTKYEYESKASRYNSDRECKPLALCTSAQYQTEEPTKTSDRQCADLRASATALQRTPSPPKPHVHHHVCYHSCY